MVIHKCWECEKLFDAKEKKIYLVFKDNKTPFWNRFNFCTIQCLKNWLKGKFTNGE